jgi:hypothetical protein
MYVCAGAIKLATRGGRWAAGHNFCVSILVNA